MVDFSKTRLRGKHNAENVMAAMAAVHSRGVSLSTMAETVYSYQPPRHRCELTAVIDDVEFINDSKSTNLHSLESSLRSLRHPLILILLLLVGLGGAFVMGRQLDRSFLPERSTGDLRLEVELPAGTPLEETAATVGQLAAWFEEQPSVRNVFTQVGRTERTLAAMREYTAPNSARLRIILDQTRGSQRRSKELQAEASQRLTQLSEIQFVFREEGIGLGEILGDGGASFNMGVLAEEPREALALAGRLGDWPEPSWFWFERETTPTITAPIPSPSPIRTNVTKR